MNTTPSNRILIVEDEQDVVDMLTLNLRKAGGFIISTADDGAAGLRKAREELPALIILDLMLPKIPGLEVCKTLKSDGATRHIPIMMLTAKAEEIDRIVGLEVGADDYVTKPFSPREIVLRIKAIMRRGQGEAAPEQITIGRSPLIPPVITSRWMESRCA
jgi:two-component system phosphate regulon response regulator PhoB